MLRSNRQCLNCHIRYIPYPYTQCNAQLKYNVYLHTHRSMPDNALQFELSLWLNDDVTNIWLTHAAQVNYHLNIPNAYVFIHFIRRKQHHCSYLCTSFSNEASEIGSICTFIIMMPTFIHEDVLFDSHLIIIIHTRSHCIWLFLSISHFCNSFQFYSFFLFESDSPSAIHTWTLLNDAGDDAMCHEKFPISLATWVSIDVYVYSKVQYQ